MAEEHRCQAPEGHRLCVNNCGFFGSSATMNLCSKCYRDLHLKEQQQASMKSTVESSLSPSSASSSATPPYLAIGSASLPMISAVSEKPGGEVEVAAREEDQMTATATATMTMKSPLPPQQQQQQQQQQPSRCSVCRKRVGLTGFKCRCGTTFCGSHRYPETHGCTFDFKSVGREEIAKANPVVKAAKLEKI